MPEWGRLRWRDGGGSLSTVDGPLLTAEGSRRARYLLAGCSVLLIVIGLLVRGGSSQDALDSAVDNVVIGWFSWAPDLPRWLAYPAGAIPASVLTVVLAASCLLSTPRRLNGAVLGATAIPVTALLCDEVFKPIFHRTYLGDLSYPSGHTATMFALATAVTILAFRPRAAWRVITFGAACVVAIGVIGVRWHYFTDTMAGAALGSGTVCGLALLLDLPRVRRLLAWRRRG
jgi:membrane-associated phospholipid phosphatase